MKILLEKCAQAIEQTVVPELSKVFAKEQAMAVVTILQLLAFNMEEKDHMILTENEKIRKVLAKSREVLCAGTRTPHDRLREDIINMLDNAVKNKGEEQYDAKDENDSLRRALQATIKAVNDLSDVLPGASVHLLSQEIHSVLRYQLDREMALITKKQWSGPRFLDAE